MTLTKKEAKALVVVLSLAENHQMWLDPASRSELFKEFVEDQYAAIMEVREFLKRNGVMTLYEFTQRNIQTYEKLGPADPSNSRGDTSRAKGADEA